MILLALLKSRTMLTLRSSPVSGFSLSYKALGLIRNKRHSEVLDCLSSSVFRRGMRLVLPPAVIHFFAMLATYGGLYGIGPGSRQPPRYETFGENVALWMRSVIELADPFRPSVYPGGYNPTYDTNLWTIPVEFHGSMAIFLTLMGLAKVHTPVRIFVLSGLVVYLLYYAYTHMFLFIGGVLIAELGHMREAGKKDRTDLQERQPSNPDRSNLLVSGENTRTRVKTASWTASFIIALFVLSMPLTDFGARNSPGFITLSTMIPPNYRQHFFEDQFWIHVAAMLLVFTIDNAKFLQPIFTTRFAQWLGKISFALYILHGHFLYTIGWNLSARAFEWTGTEPGFQYGLGVALTLVVMFPLLFWTSHIVANHVDARSVTFARWLYIRCSKAA
jgi:peptidoglycan/LPS O-acetylase OafA/YrhL